MQNIDVKINDKFIENEKNMVFYNDEELKEKLTCAKIAQVQKERTRNVQRIYPYYNLDMIISIRFKVNFK